MLIEYYSLCLQNTLVYPCLGLAYDLSLILYLSRKFSIVEEFL